MKQVTICYTYCHNIPIKFVDKKGNWIHVAIAALVGGAVGGTIELIKQLYWSNWYFSGADYKKAGIAAASGAVKEL